MRLPIRLFPVARLLSQPLPLPLPSSSTSTHVRQSHHQSQSQSHHAPTPSSTLRSSLSASGTPPPFVWRDGATPDDQRQILHDFSYFPRVLSDAQQHTLLKAALDRLDHVGSHASRRKRIRLLRSTDPLLSRNVHPGTFIPDEYYDFEHVRCHPYRSLSAPPPFSSTSSPHLSSRRTLTKSSSSSERPASHNTSGRTKRTSSPSSAKSRLCSRQCLFRHTYYT